jgi:allantoate deiminase
MGSSENHPRSIDWNRNRLHSKFQVHTTTGTAQLAKQAIARCRRLAELSEDSNGTRRTFLSPPMRDIHREISEWLRHLGATVRIDAVGNLRALYPSGHASAPCLLIGSHLDTVPNAGAFDGVLGVVLAVALLQGLDGRRLPYAVEVVGFSEEEGVRFGVPFIGSRGLVGRVDVQLLETRDERGVSLREAIAAFGLNLSELADAEVRDLVSGYLEFHIEQGPVLENLGLPLAVVEAISGQSRLDLTFAGRANHAGTTPMDLRFDSVAGAAEWITTVEREARAVPGLVATVGSVETRPGATNVIAAETRVTLDVRHREDAVRMREVETLTNCAREVARRRGLSVNCSSRMAQKTVAMDPFLGAQIEEAIRKIGCKPHRMSSGAGHDAMILAEKVPSAMIFLRSPGGISHDPAETVAVEDVEKAIECGLHLLEQLASAPEFLTRTCRA